MERNKVVQELRNKRIVVDGKFYILETPALCPNPVPDLQFNAISLQSIPVISPYSYVDIQLPDFLEPNQTYLIKPSDDSTSWQPQTLQAVGNLIKFQNNSNEYIVPTDQSAHIQLAQLTTMENQLDHENNSADYNLVLPVTVAEDPSESMKKIDINQNLNFHL